jgi:hypothetical protein
VLVLGATRDLDEGQSIRHVSCAQMSVLSIELVTSGSGLSTVSADGAYTYAARGMTTSLPFARAAIAFIAHHCRVSTNLNTEHWASALAIGLVHRARRVLDVLDVLGGTKIARSLDPPLGSRIHPRVAGGSAYPWPPARGSSRWNSCAEPDSAGG